MTEEEFKATSEKLRDSKVHLCVAELSDGSVPVGAHGKTNEVIALATYALIAAIRQSREPFRTYLRTKTATDILNSMVEDTSVFNGGRAKKKKKKKKKKIARNGRHRNGQNKKDLQTKYNTKQGGSTTCYSRSASRSKTLSARRH